MWRQLHKLILSSHSKSSAVNSNSWMKQNSQGEKKKKKNEKSFFSFFLINSEYWTPTCFFIRENKTKKITHSSQTQCIYSMTTFNVKNWNNWGVLSYSCFPISHLSQSLSGSFLRMESQDNQCSEKPKLPTTDGMTSHETF